MILRSQPWRPASESAKIPSRATIVRTAAGPSRRPCLPDGARAAGRRSADRTRRASRTVRTCPTAGTARRARTSCWRTPIPGLAHSSPIVWGNRIFVTSAVSSDAEGDLPPGPLRRRRRVRRSLAAALDDLRDRQAHRQDRCGSASRYEGEPIDKRHIKSTYASATPATDGRIVVAWFGSQGVHAYDVERQLPVEGRSRPPRHRRLRHPDVRVGTGELADHLERPRHPAVRHAGRFVPAGAEGRDRRDGVEDRRARSCRRGARRRWR